MAVVLVTNFCRIMKACSRAFGSRGGMSTPSECNKFEDLLNDPQRALLPNDVMWNVMV